MFKWFKKLSMYDESLPPTIASDSTKPNVNVAEKLHDAYRTIQLVETTIEEAFEKYEPEIYDGLDFSIGSDDYDNSIEIYINNKLPYPYEPCRQIREAIYNLGFSMVFWNFLGDTMDVICDRYIGQGPTPVKNSPDEIRGWEPRHNKNAHWISTKYGYVDDRFNEHEWLSKYGRDGGI